jgi:hypothetical protein
MTPKSKRKDLNNRATQMEPESWHKILVPYLSSLPNGLGHFRLEVVKYVIL